MNIFRDKFKVNASVLIKKSKQVGTIISIIDDVIYIKNKGEPDDKAIPKRTQIQNRELFSKFTTMLTSMNAQPGQFLMDDKKGVGITKAKGYLVRVDDKEELYAESELDHNVVVHWDPDMLAAFLETHQGPDYSAGQGSAAGQGSGSGIASDKGGNKRNKRSRNKRTKRTKRTKHNKRRR